MAYSSSNSAYPTTMGNHAEDQDVELADPVGQWHVPQESTDVRKKVLLGAAVAMAVIMLVASVGAVAYMAFGSDDASVETTSLWHGCAPTTTDDYKPMYSDEKKATFRTPTMTVHPMRHNEVLFGNVDRPEGDIAIHMVRARLHNAHSHVIVPNTQVYNHHLFVGDYLRGADGNVVDFRILSAIGAEAMRFDRPIPKPFVMISEKEREWAFSAHLVNQWGMASGASVELYVEYEIFYREITDMEAMKPFCVSFDIYGQGISSSSSSESLEEEQSAEGHVDLPSQASAGGNPFDTTASWFPVYSRSTYHDDSAGEVGVDVPGDGDAGSTFIVENVFEWTREDTVMVWASGHIHIGARDLKLYDDSTGELILHSEALYDESQFIADITSKDMLVQLSTGMRLRLVARYDNSADYKNVMALVLVATTDNVGSLDAMQKAIAELS